MQANKSSLSQYATIESLKTKASLKDLELKADITMVKECIWPLASKKELKSAVASKVELSQVQELLGSKVDVAVFKEAIGKSANMT